MPEQGSHKKKSRPILLRPAVQMPCQLTTNKTGKNWQRMQDGQVNRWTTSIRAANFATHRPEIHANSFASFQTV